MINFVPFTQMDLVGMAIPQKPQLPPGPLSLTMCVNQDSQIEIATNWSCPNTWPSSLQFLKAGGVPGRQSNDRAELFAIFIALTVASKIHIFSDSKYALGVLDDIVNSTICLWELANRANWDIICKIVAAVGTRRNTSVDAR